MGLVEATAPGHYRYWRHGEIIRFFAPDYKRSEVFAHTGGFPLGLAFDRAGNLISCVGAMGLYAISRSGEVTKLSAETKRSWTSIVDDARLRDPNDCDIAPDGRIFFTDSTTRYDAHEWALDSIESRPTGRLLCYDPRTGKTSTILDRYRYANGAVLFSAIFQRRASNAPWQVLKFSLYEALPEALKYPEVGPKGPSPPPKVKPPAATT